jgi:hypothetical protein
VCEPQEARQLSLSEGVERLNGYVHRAYGDAGGGATRRPWRTPVCRFDAQGRRRILMLQISHLPRATGGSRRRPL